MTTGEKEKKKGSCKYLITHARKSCGRDLYDDEHCIFHSRDIEGKKTDFNDAFWKEFERQNKCEDKFDFTGFIFPCEFSSFKGKNINLQTFFDDSQFHGNAIFTETHFDWGVSFRGASFFREVDFKEARFEEKPLWEKVKQIKEHTKEENVSILRRDIWATFIETKFKEKANFFKAHFFTCAKFIEAEFSGMAIFAEAQFHKGANFDRACFSGGASFCMVKYCEDASFQNVHFLKEFNFERAKFYRGVKFMEAQFSGEADFKRAQFFMSAAFENARFSGRADFLGAKFTSIRYYIKDLEENIAKCRKELTEMQAAEKKTAHEAGFGRMQASLKEEQIKTMQAELKILQDIQYDIDDDYEKYDFNRVKFKEEANFKDITIEKYNNFEMKYTYFYNVSGLFEFIEANKKKFKYSNKTEFLPDNFRLILGEEATAIDPINSRKIRDDMYLLKFKEKHPKLHFIWWLFADCGRSFLRWALWSLIIAEVFAIIFGLFYYCNPVSFKSEVISFSWPGISFLYYSIVTFTTLGFGDIVPKIPGLQIIIMIEVILGYVMLGGLISILANKLARRS